MIFVPQPSVLDDDDRDFKRTRRTTDSSERSSGGGSTVVATSADKSRKRRAEDVGNRSEFSKIPKEELNQTARADSQTKVEPTQRNKSDLGSHDDVTYPIPSAMHRDRRAPHLENQEGSSRAFGANSQEESIGRHVSPPWDRRGDRTGRGRSYQDRYRDDRSRHNVRDDRERGGTRRSRCRDYDGMVPYRRYFTLLSQG